ncbi:UNVERIFIED_CONTAM: hypothetical protein PYX00_009402 [Menopon gallinae]|uniref:Golgi SNAP receptor complex member 1 n=1 Tax=Menopon gallinae TaxID=328185 RepID=A0AAW2HB50_9NEOP
MNLSKSHLIYECHILPDLQKQARQLENEIDLKLVTFSKLGVGHASLHKNESDTEPLLGHDHSFEATAAEIQHLLSKLSAVSENLADLSATSPPTAAVLHTIQRHKEILQDYTQEFNKTQANYRARKEREDLLRSVRSDIDNYKSSNGLNRRMDLNLKENEHVRNSNRLIDEQIAIAMETRDHLSNQRIMFKRFQTRMNDLNNRFPFLNSLIQRIHVRKRRDSLILATVICLCIFLTIAYLFWG